MNAALLFSLKCAESSAQVLVTTNGLPVPGVYSVNPSIGKELLDLFTFTAAAWSDPDLPLSYAFGYMSSQNNRNNVDMFLQGKSEDFSLKTIMPAGNWSSYVEVFDSLGSFTRAFQSMVVLAQATTDLQNTIANLLNSNSENDASTLQSTISVISSILNKVTCNVATVCSSLHREECSKIDNTCGPCKNGFIGEIGDANTRCVNPSESFISNSSNSKCISDANCGIWEVCDIKSQSCYVASKQCLQNCLYPTNGYCEYVDTNTNVVINDCKVNDGSCKAVCNCNDAYTGPSCSITYQELQSKQDIRRGLLQSLSFTVTNQSIVSNANLVIQSNSLSLLTQISYEVPASMVQVVNNVALTILSSAMLQSNKANDDVVSYNSMTGVLDSVDSIASVSSSYSSVDSTIQILSMFTDLVSSQSIVGENPVEYVYDSFTLSSISTTYTSSDSNITAQVPVNHVSNRVSNFGTSSVSIYFNSSSSSSSISDVVNVNLVSTTPSLYGVVASSFNSNPLQVKVSHSTSSSIGISLRFKLAHNLKTDYTNTSYAASLGFNTSCTGPDDFNVETFTCPLSGKVLVHECKGSKGIIQSYCPILGPVCAIYDSTTAYLDSNSSICVVEASDPYSTTCLCAIESSESNGRRMDSGVESMVLNVVSTTEYIANNFKDTFLSVPDLNSFAALQRVLIVIILFVTLWTVGLILIFGCMWRRKLMEKKNLQHKQILSRKEQSAQVSYSPAVVQQNLLSYVSKVFPSIFSNEPIYHRLLGEIKKHHRYLTIFTASSGEIGDKQRILTGIQLLSVQTMLMFLLALLYDLQGPSDDGSCVSKLTKIDCLQRKSVLDQKQPYCEWSYSDSSDDFRCEYHQPVFTFQTVLVIALFVSLMTATLSKPIDMIFDLLSAPIADELKLTSSQEQSNNILNRVGRRVSNAARRLSNVASTLTNTTLNKISDARKSVLGLMTRKIPTQTEEAHTLASASMTVLADFSMHKLQERKLARLRAYYGSESKYATNLNECIGDHSDDSSVRSNSHSGDSSSSDSSNDENDSEHEIRQVTNTNLRRKNNVNALEITEQLSYTDNVVSNSDMKFESLMKEIASQRRLLKINELEYFDEQWGVDPSGEFVKADKSMFSCFKSKLGSYEIILQELSFVKTETRKKTEKLKIATDGHIGLEILHLFIKDLLGRCTPAARIFETKAAEDFEHTRIVSRNTKRLAALALFGINFFFVYFAILTGYRRGISWQQMYLAACIIQSIVEVCLFETMECIWINCLVPLLVSGEVRKVGDSIIEVINDLCSKNVLDTRLFLNAPDYLFVSTNVAKNFPHLMESILIQSYFNHVPGELAKMWQVGTIARIHRYQNFRSFTLLATLLSTIQVMATAPFIFHRLVVRFLQPVVLSVIALIVNGIISSPIYITLTALIIAGMLGYCVYRYYKSDNEMKLSPISAIIDEKIKENNENSSMNADFAINHDNETSSNQQKFPDAIWKDSSNDSINLPYIYEEGNDAKTLDTNVNKEAKEDNEIQLHDKNNKIDLISQLSSNVTFLSDAIQYIDNRNNNVKEGSAIESTNTSDIINQIKIKYQNTESYTNPSMKSFVGKSSNNLFKDSDNSSIFSSTLEIKSSTDPASEVILSESSDNSIISFTTSSNNY